MGVEINEREFKRFQRANEVCREVRFLIVEDDGIDRTNSANLTRLLERWMRVTGNSKYERPKQ